MSVREIILGLLLFVVLGMGAGVVGYISNKAGKKEKPRAWLAGIVAIVFGLFLGYAVVEVILTLESEPKDQRQ